MLEIRINNQPLDLLPDTALSFERINALFQKEVGAEGFSYPLDIPASPNNRIIFGFIEDPQSMSNFQDYDCELVIDNDIKRVTLSILKATTKYTCSLFIGLFKKSWLDRPLNELNLGGNRAVADMIAHANLIATKTVDETDYTFFPVWNDKFYAISDNESANADFYGIINGYYEGSFVPLQELPDPNDPQQGGLVTINTNTLVPFPYLRYILSQIGNLFGKSIKGSFINDPDIKQIVLFNNVDLIGVFPNYSTSINLQNHVPGITVRELLNEIIVKFGVSISINQDAIVFEFKRNALFNLEDDDYTIVVESDLTTEPFNKKETTGYIFSSEIDTDDIAIKNFADNTVKDGKINGTVIFKNQLPTPSVLDEIYFVVYDNAFFRAAVNAGDHTTYQPYFGIKDAANYKVGDGGEKIESKSSTLIMRKHIPNVSEYPPIASLGLCPNTDVVGVSVGLDFNVDKKNTCPLKFLFYRGLQPNYDAKLVPLGSNDVWNALAGKVGDLSLQWYNEFGLYEKLHKDFTTKIERAKAITYNIYFTPNHLTNLNLLNPKRIQNQKILIEKINYAITQNGTKKATVRTLKL
jgi:hypothetical protein